MTLSERENSKFFLCYSLCLLLIVVVGFPSHAIVNAHKLPPMRPLLHFHAISLGLWYVLFFTQATLIQRGKRALHQKLGTLSVLLVLVMLPTGLLVSMQNAERTGDDTVLLANTVNVLVFSMFYVSALLCRNTPELHKRLMTFAALSLMLPAFARLAYIFDLPDFAPLPLWIGLAVILPLHDIVRDKKISKGSIYGLVGVVLHVAALIIFVGPPPA